MESSKMDEEIRKTGYILQSYLSRKGFSFLPFQMMESLNDFDMMALSPDMVEIVKKSKKNVRLSDIWANDRRDKIHLVYIEYDNYLTVENLKDLIQIRNQESLDSHLFRKKVDYNQRKVLKKIRDAVLAKYNTKHTKRHVKKIINDVKATDRGQKVHFNRKKMKERRIKMVEYSKTRDYLRQSRENNPNKHVFELFEAYVFLIAKSMNDVVDFLKVFKKYDFFLLEVYLLVIQHYFALVWKETFDEKEFREKYGLRDSSEEESTECSESESSDEKFPHLNRKTGENVENQKKGQQFSASPIITRQEERCDYSLLANEVIITQKKTKKEKAGDSKMKKSSSQNVDATSRDKEMSQAFSKFSMSSPKRAEKSKCGAKNRCRRKIDDVVEVCSSDEQKKPEQSSRRLLRSESGESNGSSTRYRFCESPASEKDANSSECETGHSNENNGLSDSEDDGSLSDHGPSLNVKPKTVYFEKDAELKKTDEPAQPSEFLQTQENDLEEQQPLLEFQPFAKDEQIAQKINTKIEKETGFLLSQFQKNEKLSKDSQINTKSGCELTENTQKTLQKKPQQENKQSNGLSAVKGPLSEEFAKYFRKIILYLNDKDFKELEVLEVQTRPCKNIEHNLACRYKNGYLTEKDEYFEDLALERCTACDQEYGNRTNTSNKGDSDPPLIIPPEFLECDFIIDYDESDGNLGQDSQENYPTKTFVRQNSDEDEKDSEKRDK